MRYILVLLIAIGLSAAVYVDSASAGSTSTVASADGGKIRIFTSKRRGTTITVFDRNGNPLCTRTSSITDHAAAIAKFKNMRC